MKIQTMKQILFSLLLLCLSVAALAQTKTVYEQRANNVITIINEPKDFEKFFSPGFLAAVPPEQIAAIGKQLVEQYGKALKVEKITPQGAYNGKILISFEKGFVAEMNLTIEEKSPNLIDGLLITGVTKAGTNSFEDIIAEMKKLPGQTALTVAKLNEKDFQTLAAHNADKPLAIGSTFKLYILSELVRSITAGERKWSDVVELNYASLPSGQMQNWEKGAPVTLHTLASMMISISDNTATDQLLITLGREKVEKMLSVTGNSNPNLSIPFLTTFEMFKLKGVQPPQTAERYLAKDAAGKRQMLANEVAKFTKDDIALKDFLAKPTYISQLEWFASPNDLARLMNWLRLNTEKPPANKACGVLTINKALPPPEAANWNYVGYKGGSETGVISLTYLLQSKKGEWFVVSASWNDEKSAVSDRDFVSLVQKTVQVLREKSQ